MKLEECVGKYERGGEIERERMSEEGRGRDKRSMEGECLGGEAMKI